MARKKKTVVDKPESKESVGVEDTLNLFVAQQKLKDVLSKFEEEDKNKPRVVKITSCSSVKHNDRGSLDVKLITNERDKKTGEYKTRKLNWSNNLGSYTGKVPPAFKCEACHYLDDKEAREEQDKSSEEIKKILDERMGGMSLAEFKKLLAASNKLKG